ncbi:ComEC/Rec2 family competence protein [Candidatus Uhrbacteria bacterium]|nr:ComEC/Rec2 family competence protein [Candidatus Uhrbacteria bacterium]
MVFHIPTSVGAIAGWCFAAFVAGVAAATGWHRFDIASATLAIILFLAAFAFVLPVSTKTKCLAALMFAFFLGVWRVDVSPRPELRRIGNVRMLVAQPEPTRGIPGILAGWRKTVTARIASVLPPDDAALVAGILYGDAELSKTARDAFRSSGLTHLVAVSGANVTVLVQFFAIIIARIGLRRRHAFFLTSLAIIVFVGFVGFAASVARAAFMGWLILLAREVGRPVQPLRLLLVVAVLLLLINPWQLLYDIGFALSFLATWGILCWAPLIEAWCRRLPKRFGIREAFSMTAAATLCTAPYAAWAFDRLTLVGLLTNLLAAPLIPFIMGWGALVAVWGNFFAHDIVMLPASGFVKALQGVSHLHVFFPWLDLRITGVNLSTLIGTYALLIYFWFQLSGKNGLSTEKRDASDFSDVFEATVRGQ